MTDSLGSGSAAATLIWAGTGYAAFAAASATTTALTVQFVDVDGAVRCWVL